MKLQALRYSILAILLSSLIYSSAVDNFVVSALVLNYTIGFVLLFWTWDYISTVVCKPKRRRQQSMATFGVEYDKKTRMAKFLDKCCNGENYHG